MSVGMGLLEITLVGGWLVHGLATLYFRYTNPTEEPIQEQPKNIEKEDRAPVADLQRSSSRSSVSSISDSEPAIDIISQEEFLRREEEAMKGRSRDSEHRSPAGGPYLLLAGYADYNTRGQIRCDFEAHPLVSDDTSFLSSMRTFNALACLPIANIIIGIYHVGEGLLTDGALYHAPLGLGKWQFKIMRIGVGVLELTLVGGWLVHGLATLYFYCTSPSEEPIQKQRKNTKERDPLPAADLRRSSSDSSFSSASDSEPPVDIVSQEELDKIRGREVVSSFS